MKTLKFQCTLLSDVILNMKSASVGNNNTLDFIPGNNFLGIVAKKYKELGPLAMTIFHSGKVRFGDAHLGDNGMRSLRIPAAMFYPKLSCPAESCYIHHRIKAATTNLQLKQCRQGFYVFNGDEAVKVNVDKRFAIKSAYDRDKRRSADEMMFGYESIAKGAVFYFSVETDDDSLSDILTEALSGIHHLGRSRTAQYGLVNICPVDFLEVSSMQSSDIITIYADGRLIFLDSEGTPTFRPTAEQLGIKGGEILWEMCQIRTFSYSPWNFMRQCFDTDRCGIEKGSVFVVKGGSICNAECNYVGSYRNEGFGKVIYNPVFLDAYDDGSAKCKICDVSANFRPDTCIEAKGNEALLKRLIQKQQNEAINVECYRMVNDFVGSVGKKFRSASFASQWGSIRAIVTNCKSKEEIRVKLFDGKDSYLKHGVAKDKWEEYGRINALEKFFNTLSDANAVPVMINLSAEMAKFCAKGVKDDKKQ